MTLAVETRGHDQDALGQEQGRAARSVLIVSPYFPPSAMAGVHRARHLVKHLPAHGWHPIVVCVHEKYYEQAPDPALAGLVPTDAEIFKVDALPTKVMRTMGVGDISLRAFLQIRRAVLSLVRSRRVEAVLITGSPYYPMLLAPSIRKLGVPVVLDFQDPWVSRWGATRPRFSKAGLSHWLATHLEPRAVRSASFITSVSGHQNEDMLRRYPMILEAACAALPIGGDPDDFVALRDSDMAAADLLDPTKFNLSFVGTFMPRSGPLMRAFLAGVRRSRSAQPDLSSRLRLNFIGTGNHSEAREQSVLAIARELGVDDLVFELPQRIAFSRAIAAQSKSDAIMLIGSDEPHYTASKIYPGLMSGRPFISLFHKMSSSHQLLSTLNGGLAFAYDPDGEPATIEAQIAEGVTRLVLAPEAFDRIDSAAYSRYEANAIAGEFARIFDAVSSPCA